MFGRIYLKVCWKQQTNCFDYPLSKEKSLWNAMCVCVVCACVHACMCVKDNLYTLHVYVQPPLMRAVNIGF